jgi:hypothetical protein
LVHFQDSFREIDAKPVTLTGLIFDWDCGGAVCAPHAFL